MSLGCEFTSNGTRAVATEVHLFLVPCRPAVLMTTSMEGQLDVYDFLYKQNEPALSLQVSLCLCTCECICSKALML